MHSCILTNLWALVILHNVASLVPRPGHGYNVALHAMICMENVNAHCQCIKLCESPAIIIADSIYSDFSNTLNWFQGMMAFS